jgi:hypothetical protein
MAEWRKVAGEDRAGDLVFWGLATPSTAGKRSHTQHTVPGTGCLWIQAMLAPFRIQAVTMKRMA